MNRKITRVEIESDRINIYRGEWNMRAYPYSARNFSRLSFVCGIQPEGLTRYHTDRLEWYRNVNSRTPEYVSGEWDTVRFEFQRDWSLKITIADRDLFDEIIQDNDRFGFWAVQGELLESALTNGWELDPDDDGRTFISQAHLNDYGDDDPDYEIQAGDLGWYHDEYIFKLWYDELEEKGSVTFRPYYFGETLDEQRSL